MRCEPGDIAIVIDDIEAPENNGKMVRVECRADPVDAPFEWGCTPIGLPLLFADGSITTPEDIGDACYHDRELQPLCPKKPQDGAICELLRPLPQPVKETV